MRHPLARFDGTVSLGDTRVTVESWTGSVNHNWGGSKHTPCVRLRSGVRIRRASALQPGGGHRARRSRTAAVACHDLFVLRHAGWQVAVRSILSARHTRGSYAPFEWSFGGRTDGFELHGEIRTEPGDVIGLTYTDTDSATKYCYNSAMADCRITLSGNGVDTELAASRRAMFEILTDQRLEAVPLLV